MTEHETQGPYQLSRNLSALDLLLLLGLPPLPDLVLQLLPVHGLLLPVRGVPDVVVDRLPDALVTLEPEQTMRSSLWTGHCHLISGFPNIAVLILPDFVLCGAPQPGLPKARASCK